MEIITNLLKNIYIQILIAFIAAILISISIVPVLTGLNDKVALGALVMSIPACVVTLKILKIARRKVKLHELLLYLLIAASFIGPALTFKLGPISMFPFRALYLVVVPMFFLYLYKKKDIIEWRQIPYKSIFIFMIAWILFAIASLIWAKSLILGIKNLFYLSTGISLVFIISFLFTKLKNYLMFFYIWIVMLVLLLVLGFWNHLTQNHLSVSRINDLAKYMQSVPTAVFGNENDYASYLSISLFFVVSLIKYQKNWFVKLLGVGVVLGSIYIIYVTSSRANYISILLGFGVWLLLYGGKKLKTIIFTMSGVGVLLIGTLFYSRVIAVLDKIKSEVFATNNGGSIDVRTNILKNVYAYFEESYGLGVGAGNAQYYLKNHAIYPIDIFSNVHNWWAEIMVNYGAIIISGYLALYISVLYILFNISRKKYDDNVSMISEALTTSLLVFSLASISPSSVLTLNYHWMLFSFSIGFIVYYSTRYSHASTPITGGKS
ncbi:O-antigen ligase family protein [Guptibacillus algicola]|uniref:O-antigen ligase family protein n=1 Tax=Guptibacillus algicola TaxID=225844 RepID=UPI001CD2F107|nr:O-antigen ligase family protein [Alkalihalobacillus algicola]MCA0986856.1 O-antigen ligase family protein [Alkalihalobacillus algicola]